MPATPRATSSTRASSPPADMLPLVVLAFAIGLVLFAIGLKGLIRGTAAMRWRTLPGRVLSAAIAKRILAGRYRLERYVLEVECEYAVGEQTFRCRQLTPFRD